MLRRTRLVELFHGRLFAQSQGKHDDTGRKQVPDKAQIEESVPRDGRRPLDLGLGPNDRQFALHLGRRRHVGVHGYPRSGVGTQ
jgi:hypothetical protein